MLTSALVGGGPYFAPGTVGAVPGLPQNGGEWPARAGDALVTRLGCALKAHLRFTAVSRSKSLMLCETGCSARGAKYTF